MNIRTQLNYDLCNHIWLLNTNSVVFHHFGVCNQLRCNQIHFSTDCGKSHSFVFKKKQLNHPRKLWLDSNVFFSKHRVDFSQITLKNNRLVWIRKSKREKNRSSQVGLSLHSILLKAKRFSAQIVSHGLTEIMDLQSSKRLAEKNKNIDNL